SPRPQGRRPRCIAAHGPEFPRVQIGRSACVLRGASGGLRSPCRARGGHHGGWCFSVAPLADSYPSCDTGARAAPGGGAVGGHGGGERMRSWGWGGCGGGAFGAAVVSWPRGAPAATGAATPASSLPSGFTDSVVFSGLDAPTAIAFAPDGRVYVAEKPGVIK